MPVTTRSRTRAQLAEAVISPPKLAASRAATLPDHLAWQSLPVISLLSNDHHIGIVDSDASTVRKRAKKETRDVEQALTLDQPEDEAEVLASPPKKRARKSMAKTAKTAETAKPSATPATTKKVSAWPRGRLTEEQKDNNRLRT